MLKIEFALLLALQTSSAAAGQAPAPPAARPDCSAPNYRELDFWVGEWEVFDTAKGYRIATSRVDPIMAGCSVRERYDSPEAPGGAYSGTSYSGYDRKDGRWHQMYVDVRGNLTVYSGRLEGKDMVLAAEGKGGSLQRMTYRPLGNGAVRQIGLLSTDGGKTWLPGYDYTYRKR